MVLSPRSEASRANMLVLKTSNLKKATIRPIVPRNQHSIVLMVHHKIFLYAPAELFFTFLDESRLIQM